MARKISFLPSWKQLSKGAAFIDRPEPDHRLEREQFEKVLATFKASRIDDRLTVLDIFLLVEQHITLSGLQDLIRDQKPALQDRTFLQETMDMFCQFGFAQKQSFDNQEALYEHHHLGDHHDHFICTRCGLIQEFSNPELEKLQLAVARKSQFHPLQHKMEIYGLCESCMRQRDETLPLVLTANGEHVKIVKIMGGRSSLARLADLGLSVGTCLKVISNHSSGPLIVGVHESRLALPAGLAEKIFVAHYCLHSEE